MKVALLAPAGAMYRFNGRLLDKNFGWENKFAGGFGE